MKYLVCYNGKWLKVPMCVYKDYFDIIENLDNSERSRELKIAVFKYILKRSDKNE